MGFRVPGSVSATRAQAFAKATEAGSFDKHHRSTGGILVFLHADTRLPRDAFSTIRSLLHDSQVESGAFRLRFDTQTPLLRFYSLCTRLRLPQICFGDRVLFVRRHVFEEVGGFPGIPIFEDLAMVRLLHRRGGFRFLPDYVTTSARRFVHRGPLRQQLLNGFLWCRFMAGADPAKLAHFYEYNVVDDSSGPA